MIRFEEVAGQGRTLGVTLTDNGRVVSIGFNDRMIYSRDQRAAGGKPIRIAQEKFRACRDAACAASAYFALMGKVDGFPKQEIDL